MKVSIVIRAIVVVSMVASSSPSSARCQSPDMTAANEAWNRRDWAVAARAYEAVARADTTQALPYIRLGVALTALGRYTEAQRHLEMAERRGAPVSQVAFRMGVADAGAGKLDDAFRQLKRATDAGLGRIPVPGDSLAPMQKVKGDPRFANFLTDMDRNARPCMHDPKHNEFDFWVGTWDVRPRGQPANPPAKNVVTKIDDGCVVHESWTAPGSVGQSFNIWDRTRQKWFQIWVDNSGGLHEYSGAYSDNAMRYEGEMPAGRPGTGRVKVRLTFFRIAPDTVRQFAERLQPDGAWITSYDLMYTKN